MRDSESVRLTWSLPRGPAVGGLGGLPRGFLPVFLACASRLANFFLKLHLQAVRVVPAQRLVLAGIGLDLGAIQADAAQLHQPHHFGHHQYLHKQSRKLCQKPLSETGNRVVVRVAVGTDITKGNRIIAGLLQLARRIHTRGITVKQQRHQHRRMERL